MSEPQSPEAGLHTSANPDPPDGAPGRTRRVWRWLTGGSVSDVKAIRDVNSSGTDDCVEGGWDYKVRPDDTRYSDNGPVAALGLELALWRIHPHLEASVVAPEVSWRDRRYVSFSLALGMTGIVR